jgi:hypothetical protein
MTKPEPLKGRGWKRQSTTLYRKQDVRSAVEWFLENIGYWEEIKEYQGFVSYEIVYEKIKEAFEDVMKDDDG